MRQRLTFKYMHPTLNVALNSWREVYLLFPARVKLHPEVYRGKLVYRAKGSQKRIPYTRIKAGLLKRAAVVEQEVPDWL